MLCQLSSSSSSSSLLCCVNYWRLSTSTTPRPAQDVEDVGEQVTPLHWDYQDKKMSGSPSINLRSWYSIMDKISVLTFCRGIQFIRSFGSFSLSYYRTQIPGKHSQGQWRDLLSLLLLTIDIFLYYCSFLSFCISLHHIANHVTAIVSLCSLRNDKMQNKILFFFFFMHQSYSLNHIGKAKQEYIQSVMCCLLFYLLQRDNIKTQWNRQRHFLSILYWRNLRRFTLNGNKLRRREKG